MARIDSDKCMFPVSTSEGNVREGEGYRCGGQGSVGRSVGRYVAGGKGAPCVNSAEASPDQGR